MKNRDPFVEEVYHFKGEWDVPSQCGLKIIRKHSHTIIVVTEFYDSNPGTSVTQWNTHLAKEICQTRNIDPNHLIFIEHTPEMSSKLSFYHETFDRVIFSWDGENFINPKWERLDKTDVMKLIDA
jgi:hypothetical protein